MPEVEITCKYCNHKWNGWAPINPKYIGPCKTCGEKKQFKITEKGAGSGDVFGYYKTDKGDDDA